MGGYEGGGGRREDAGGDLYIWLAFVMRAEKRAELGSENGVLYRWKFSTLLKTFSWDKALERPARVSRVQFIVVQLILAPIHAHSPRHPAHVHSHLRLTDTYPPLRPAHIHSPHQ